MDDSTTDAVAAVLNDYPYMWMLYGFTVVLPAVAVIAYCLWPKRIDAEAHRKKTDDPSPDDKISEEERRRELKRPSTENHAVLQSSYTKEEARENGTVREIPLEVESAALDKPKEAELPSLPERLQSQLPKEAELPSLPERLQSQLPKEAELPSLPERLQSQLPKEAELPSLPERLQSQLLKDSAVSEKGRGPNASEEDAPVISIADEEVQLQEEVTHEQVAEEEESGQEVGGAAEQELEESGAITEEETGKTVEEQEGEDGGEVEEEGVQWSFPPKLEEFNLMDSDADPDELEAIFADERLVEIMLNLELDGPGLGISIVGGSGSPSGDLPIVVKRVLPGSLTEGDGRLKSGDELVAVNDTLLVGVRKDFAINALSNMQGRVRLLVLQDD